MRRLVILALGVITSVPAFGAITGIVMNADGQPVAGARASLYALETVEARRARLLSEKPERAALATSESDARGKFSFESPKDAAVDLHIIASGYAPESVRAERDEDLGAILMAKAETKTGTMTSGGKPVAGARVIWSPPEISVVTDEKGRYSVPDPNKWAGRVTVIHPDFVLLDEPGRRPGSATVSPDRTLSPGVNLNGSVVGEDGKSPMAGAVVTVNGWLIAKTKEDGTFAAEHAPSKWDVLEARSGTMIGTRARGSELTIRLAKSASITGSARDIKTQGGVPGTEIALRTGRGEALRVVASAFADAKGNFTLGPIPAGNYEMSAVRPGYVFNTVSVSTTVGDRAPKTLLGTELGRITGVVVDEEKRPVSGARLDSQTVSRESSMMFMPTMRMSRAATTAPDGKFAMRINPDADIQIEATKKGLPSSRSVTVRLAPGERQSGMVITMPSGVVVAGRVTDRDGGPLAGVIVGASPTTSAPSGLMQQMLVGTRRRDDEAIQTASDGTFTMRLKEGSYDFVFSREGFAPKAVRAHQVGRATDALEVMLDPGVEIAGRVTRAGEGVQGVRVMAMSEGGRSMEETAPDGSFRLSDLAPGAMMLMATKDEEFIQQVRPVTAPATDVLIEIPPGGRIAGRVIDRSTKQPVTQFQAGISSPRGGGGMVFMTPPQTRAFTSDDGAFLLENVPAGQTTVVVQAPGYTATRISNITVEEGKTVADLEVAMDRGVKVTGRVTGPGGTALSGVAVRQDAAAGRVMRVPGMSPGTITDANGEYTIEAVEPGEKTFIFSRTGYLTTRKTADLSGSESRLDVQMSTGVRVSGVVVTDSGAPVADAVVSATSASDMGTSTRTDQNGTFQMEGLAPARYNFRTSKQGFPTGQLKDVDVSSGAPVRIVLQAGGTVYGRVIGLSAEEMQQATVTANNPNGGAASPVDAAGNYRIEGAPTGTVRLTARIMGMAGGKSSPVVSVQVDPGSVVQQDIEFRNDTVLSGRVTRDGRAVGGAMLTFNPRSAQAQTSARTQTDNSGYYEVTGLDDAIYSVVVVEIQGGSYRTAYELRGSATFDIAIRTSTLRGRVIDAGNGQPLAEAAIDIRERDSGGPMRALRTIQTDPSGAFTVDGVSPGTYQVSAEKSGYGTKAVDVTVGDAPADIEIKLARQDGVTLRVVDGRDGRLLSAFVRVTDAQNRVVYDSPMRFGGGGAEPVKLALDAGTYSATISAQGYAPRRVTLVSPSSPTVGLTPGGSILVRSKGSTLRRARLLAPDGQPYLRGGMNPIFTVDPSPGVTQLENIAPGMYTLQILGNGDEVVGATQVNVMEGRRADVEI